MSSLTEIAGVSLTTFFATIGPLDIAAMFAALTTHQTPREKRVIALRGVLIATVILLIFALSGKALLSTLGISLAALRTAGGILLLLIGIEMVFARSSGVLSTTHDEEEEAIGKPDISVFPLATPLIAGPGAMGAAILLMADQAGDIRGQAVVIASLLAILLATLVSLLLAGRINQWLGVTGMHVITRVMGVLLAALAVQFVFDGIAQSGLL
ncbi:MarC family protein [Pseudomaricurvus sp. HS19]|uniref:MarC family protein n=1 Tax=Pseudomaricurvus sp. HS19 TaxID=2692626 RepID=UPI00192886AC|nr:MarC family protein [Pseudomaricurvus sp. HS19]